VAEEIATGDGAALAELAALFGREPGRSAAEEREVAAFRRLAPGAASDLD
jgi:hypothetical protein